MNSQDKARILKAFSKKFGIEEVVCLNNGEQLPIGDMLDWVYGRKHNEEMDLLERRTSFGMGLKPFYQDGVYPRKLLSSFFEYWTEPDKNNKKMRFEYEKTWSLASRLRTFASRSKFKIELPPSELDQIIDGGEVRKLNEPIQHEKLFH